MNKCEKHRKEHAGSCMWCGKKVCEFCIVRREGVKLYCEKCGPMLGGIRRESMPKVPKAPLAAELHKGQKLVFQDGYLVIDGGN